MRTIIDYVEAAKSRLDIDSDNELARRLGINGSNVNHWRHGRTWPADETMVRLAELGGEDAQLALIYLNIWRCKSPRSRELYSRLAGELARVVSVAVLTLPILGAAAERGENGLRSQVADLYIMR